MAAGCRRAIPACAASSCSSRRPASFRHQAGDAQVPDCQAGGGGAVPAAGCPASGPSSSEGSIPELEVRTVSLEPAAAGRRPASNRTTGRPPPQGRLVIQRCPSCGAAPVLSPGDLHLLRRAIPEWEEASGRGIVYTFTVIRQHGAKPFRDELPYVVAMVKLDEGPMMMGNITGCEVDDVTIGMPVEAYVVRGGRRRIGDRRFWRPAPG